jgi:hypothetical protein
MISGKLPAQVLRTLVWRRLCRRPQRWIVLLIAFHAVLVTLTVLLALKSPEAWLPEWIGEVLLMWFPSQGILLSVWAALGGRGTPWRALVAMLAVIICARMLLNELDFALVLFTSQMMNLTPILLIARLTGLELQHPATRHASGDMQRFQFSLRRLLAWTTALAAVLGATHYFPEDFDFSDYFNQESCAIHASCGLVALMSIWTSLGRRWRVLGLISCGLAVGIGTVALEHYVGFLGYLMFARLLIYQALWTTGSLCVVRWAGYKLTWRWRFRRQAQHS